MSSSRPRRNPLVSTVVGWVEAKRSAAETQHPRRAVNCWVSLRSTQPTRPNIGRSEGGSGFVEAGNAVEQTLLVTGPGTFCIRRGRLVREGGAVRHRLRGTLRARVG